MARCMAVTLLRHSLTDYNEQKKYLGWTDIPINEKGKKLLQSLQQKYSYPKGDVIISSDLIRCVTTAEILYPNTPIVKDVRLREFNFGDWEGQTYEQLKENPLYRSWLDNVNQTKPPKGETFSYFQTRVMKSWEKLINDAVDQQFQHVIIVSHGGPIRLLLSQLFPTKKNFWEWSINYGQGYTLANDVDGLRRGEQWNLLQEAPFMAKEAGYIRIIK
ncbi:histidine phosphatase family protein [Alkalihalobacterium elongatum]|uniref:histidine phosphatase family protein n=1 Tax=Alkalihalobacterium elongatum TaxID=2675466 RepID=UPI001C1F319E|nr:histidine phosphatase family protein [Alkalihalobacterium elongatum]